MQTCVAILTEWPEFKFPNFKIVKTGWTVPVVFDGRNIYDKDQMADQRFDYFCIGIRTKTGMAKSKVAVKTRSRTGIKKQPWPANVYLLQAVQVL